MPLSVFRAVASLLVVAFVAASGVARAQNFTDTGGIQPSPAGMPRQLEHVGVKEHLDESLPLDTEFRDHTGKPVRLQSFFDGKRPVVMVFAYHSCQVVCSMVMGAVLRSLQGIKWSVGNEFDVVVISIDPNDPLERTAAKRAGVIHDYGRGDGKGFHYLVGTKTNIDRVANAAGFAYEYDASQNIYGHPSLMTLVKPNGQMARYLYGLEFDPNDVRLGLLEASEGRSISTVEQMILYCYHYDPQGGKYVLVATRVMQVGGSITALLLGGALLIYWLRERRNGGLLAKLSPEHQRRKGAGPTDPAPNPT